MALLAGGALASAAQEASERHLVAMVELRTLDSWTKLEELARRFEAERPGVTVELIDQAGAASEDRVKFLLAGGLQLDLVRIDITELGAFLAEDALVDLNPYFRADPTWNEEAYFPAPLAALRNDQGHLVGLPSTFTPYVMYANLDLLQESGYPRPRPDWTWEEFLAQARTMTLDEDGDGRTDQYGISLTQWLQALSPWIWQAGGRLLSEDGTRSGFEDPRTVEAFAFLRGLLHEERVASFDASYANQLSQGLFQAGKAAFYGPVGYWETYRFRFIEFFQWDVVPLPRREQAATAVAMTCFVVPRTARHPDLAYEFLRVLAGEEYQRTMAEIGNGVPGRLSAARSTSFLKPDVAPESESVFLDVMDEARFLPPLANWRKIESLVVAELEQILLAETCDVPAACARMARRTDAYLEREARRRGLPRLRTGSMAAAVGLALLALAAWVLARRGPAPDAVGRGEERAAWIALVPWFVGFVAFLLGPAAVTLVLSMSEWSPLRGLDDVAWVGTANFTRLAADPTFHTSLGATVLYALLSVPAGIVIALALALLLRAEGPLIGIVRTICYVPAILSPVIVACLWRWLLDADQGPLDGALAAIGIEGPEWLRDAAWVVPSLALVALWSVGTQMLVFLAALQALDPALQEAARVDGAGAWARFRHVTLPGLGPVMLFNLLTGTIAAFQVFAQPYVMTQGGPGDSSRFLVLYLYESAFRHLDMGYASAIAWVLFVLLASLAAVLLASSKRWVHYAARGGAA